MKLTFLGTSHGAPEVGRYCTSVLIEHKGYHFIVDLGAPVEYLLKQRNLSLDTVKGIFITHMHADHAEALVSVTKGFAVYRHEASAQVFFPDETAIEPFKEWMKVLCIESIPDRMKLCVTKEGVIFDDFGMKVSALRTEHVYNGKKPSFAYIFEADGKKILLTGDLAYDYHDFPEITKKEHFDLVVSELTHLSAEKAQPIFKGVDTKQMIFSHVTPSNIKILEDRELSFDFPFVVASDGFEYNVVK